MTDEPVEPTPLMAERVAAIRRYRDMTQEELAEAMRSAGIPWQRITLAKFESGKRSYLTVDELLALCMVLEISPVDLIVPRELKPDQPYHVSPEATARATDVREWARGEGTLFYRYDRDEDKIRSTGRFRFVEPTGKISDPIQWMPADRAQRVEERYRDFDEEDEQQ
jgi:transcriptional regulator with XRE-family HTH domain